MTSCLKYYLHVTIYRPDDVAELWGYIWQIWRSQNLFCCKCLCLSL